MNPLYLAIAAVVGFVLLKKKDAAVPTGTGTPPSSRTPASGFPAGQPMPPVLTPPGSTGGQIGVALAQNSGEIAKAAVSVFDWARSRDFIPSEASPAPQGDYVAGGDDAPPPNEDNFGDQVTSADG